MQEQQKERKKKKKKRKKMDDVRVPVLSDVIIYY